MSIQSPKLHGIYVCVIHLILVWRFKQCEQEKCSEDVHMKMFLNHNVL